MGWTANNSLWLATRGGDVFFSPTPGISEKFDQARLGSRGFGILDVACAPPVCSCGTGIHQSCMASLLSVYPGQCTRALGSLSGAHLGVVFNHEHVQVLDGKGFAKLKDSHQARKHSQH